MTELQKVEKSIKKLLAAEQATGTHYMDADIKRLMARRKELQAKVAT